MHKDRFLMPELGLHGNKSQDLSTSTRGVQPVGIVREFYALPILR
jgi:hypothetical protein